MPATPAAPAENPPAKEVLPLPSAPAGGAAAAANPPAREVKPLPGVTTEPQPAREVKSLPGAVPTVPSHTPG